MSEQPGWAAPDGAADGRYGVEAPAAHPNQGASRGDSPTGNGPGADGPGRYRPPGGYGGYPSGGGVGPGGYQSPAAQSFGGQPVGGYPPGWQGPAPYALPPPQLFLKPGVIPLRPLGLGEILDGALTTVRRNPAATLGVAAVVSSAIQLAQFGLLAGPLAATRRQLGDHSSLSTAAFLDRLLVVVGISSLLTLIASALLTGFLTQVVGRAVLGQPMSLGQVWERTRGRLLPLIAVTLLVSGGVAVGAVLLVVPGIFLYVAWSLAVPAVVLERAGPITALRRSMALVRGSWWRVLGILVVVYLIRLVLAGILTVPFGLAGGAFSAVFSGTTSDQSTGQLLVTTIGGIVGQTVVLPFVAGAIALLYVDRRMRAEGLDVTLAQTAQRAAQASPVGS